jgi:ribosomal-protein-alanine N-acetyltransferase
MKPQEFKILKTKNLDLRPLVATFEFANTLFDIIDNNRNFFKYMPWADIEKPEQEFAYLSDSEKGWKKQTKANYGIFLKDSGDFVGVCGVFDIKWGNESGEIGYWLNPKYAGRGLMSEAVNAVTDEFLNMGFKRIIILANPENIASCRVAEKCGFVREGLLRSYDFLPVLNKREDIVLYAKINEK